MLQVLVPPGDARPGRGGLWDARGRAQKCPGRECPCQEGKWGREVTRGHLGELAAEFNGSEERQKGAAAPQPPVLGGISASRGAALLAEPLAEHRDVRFAGERSSLWERGPYPAANTRGCPGLGVVPCILREPSGPGPAAGRAVLGWQGGSSLLSLFFFFQEES